MDNNTFLKIIPEEYIEQCKLNGTEEENEKKLKVIINFSHYDLEINISQPSDQKESFWRKIKARIKEILDNLSGGGSPNMGSRVIVYFEFLDINNDQI